MHVATSSTEDLRQKIDGLTIANGISLVYVFPKRVTSVLGASLATRRGKLVATV